MQLFYIHLVLCLLPSLRGAAQEFQKRMNIPQIRTIKGVVESGNGYVILGDRMKSKVTLKAMADFDSLDLFIMKIDSAGNQLWIKTLGNPNRRDLPKGLIKDKQGNLLVLSYCKSLSIKRNTTDLRTVIYKLTPDGEVIWEKRYEGDPASISQDSDSNYVLSFVESLGKFAHDNFINDKIIIQRLDMSGNILSKLPFVEVINQQANTGSKDFILVDQKDKNASLIYTKYGTDKDDMWYFPSNIYYSYYIAKIDSQARFLSNHKIQGQKGREVLYWDKLKEGNFIILTNKIVLNHPNQYDIYDFDTLKYYASKIAPDGKVLWEKYLTSHTKSEHFNITMLFEVSGNRYVFLHNYKNNDLESYISVTLLDKKGKIITEKKFRCPGKTSDHLCAAVSKSGSLFLVSTYYTQDNNRSLNDGLWIINSDILKQ